MIANLTAAVVLAVSTASAGLPAAALNTPFPDQGEPISTRAYTDDLVEADYDNGRLPAEALVEIESNPGCLIEEEAAEAWLELEQHAMRDGVEFTAAWCYRDMKTQRRTYRRNCPWVVITPPVEEPVEEPVEPPTEPEAGAEDPTDPEDTDPEDTDPGATDPEAPGEEASEPTAEPPAPVDEPKVVVERVRVCRVPTATPGNSNHGWGRAVDLTADGALLTCESDAFVWLAANASRYGWVHPDWAACGADKEEAWHWEWGGTRNDGPTLSRPGQFTT
ncbi:MAG: hypothetical protein HKN91_14145 [Acidimicrobiia bacterium]|nr:hypothetical protein [Acidimicrobiia bacterium]